MTEPTPPHRLPDGPRITSADFSLLIIGDEILSGKRADKHMPKLIELLAARGLRLGAAEYVGDSPAHITACLRRALAHAAATGGAVFSCGGIGATPDDHTRQCAAAALGVPLALHPQAAALIHERMKDVATAQGTPYEPDKPDNLHRLNMAQFPQGASIIPNPYNKIAGFSLAVGACGGDAAAPGRPKQGAAPSGGSDPHAAGERGGVFFFPGFPVMAWPMMAWVLDTYCPHVFQAHAQLEKSVIVFGAMEATLTPLMEQIECDFPGAKVFSLPSVDHPQYGRHIELGVKGPMELAEMAYAALLHGLRALNTPLGPELVR